MYFTLAALLLRVSIMILDNNGFFTARPHNRPNTVSEPELCPKRNTIFIELIIFVL